MSRVAYIRAWPRDPANGAVGLVAMAGGGSHVPYLLGNTHYRAGIVREPRFSTALGFDENGWTGAALPTISIIEFAPADPALLRAYGALYWKDAAIEVDAGEEYAGVGRILTGTIADAVVRDGKLQITVADFSIKLGKPVIQSWFAGTGGIEGDAAAEGRVKRRSFGAVLNVEGRILNAANNIYEFGDPSRPLQNFTAVRDLGRAGSTYLVNWQGSVAATLATLIATPAAQGGAIVAPSIACVKWWTQPVGPLTADIQGENGGGYVNTPVTIAARLLSAAGGPAIVNQVEADGWRAMVAGLHIADDSETTTAALDRLLLPVSLMWRFGTTGVIDIRPWSWDAAAEVVQGRFISRDRTLAPTRTRRLGYMRNHRQHSAAEIAADILAAGATYDDGTPIEQLKPAEAGSNVTGNHSAAAFAGQGALATRNDVIYGSHVTSLPAAISPANLIGGNYLSAGFGRYIDGVTMQALRPGEANANVTESRVASAIAGQGAFATQNSVGYGSSLLTGFGSLAGLGNLFFGSPYLLESAGGALASLVAFKTGLGVASAIAGQGWGATAAQSYVDNRNVAIGQNRAVNSRFARGLYGWIGISNTINGVPYTVTRGVNLNTEYSGKRDIFYARVNTGAATWNNSGNNYADVLVTPGTWAGGTVADMKLYALPVKEGDRVAAAALVARHRCNTTVYALVVNAAGSLLSAPNWTGGRAGGANNGGDPALMDRIGDCFNVTDPTAAYCLLMVRMTPTGETDPVCFVTETMLARVAAEQIALPPYSDGPADPMADQTLANTAAAFTGQGMLATRDSLANGSSFLTGFGTLSGLGSLFFGSPYLLESSGGALASLAAFKTGLGIASGISGQGAFATQNSVGFGSSLLTGFGALAATDRVRLGVNGGMVNEANNQWLTDGYVITGLGTAAAISGQSAWATYTKSISQVVAPQSNLFPYPRPVRDGRTPSQYGWNTYVSQGDGSGWSAVAQYDGSNTGGAFYVVSRNGNYGSCTLVPYFDLELRDIQSWVLGARKAGISLNGYASNGSFAPIVDWINAAKNNTFARVSLTYNPDSGRYEGILPAAPQGAAYIRVYGGHSNFPAFNGYQDVCWWNIKVEPDAVTPYSDMSENRSLSIEWATGGSLNSLRPGEFGSNVTEGRTAAAFSGQSAWATYSGLSTATVEGRTQRLQSDGYVQATAIYYVSGGSFNGFVSDYRPQEAGANVTEGRTAAALSGQSAWATYSGLNPASVAGQVSKLQTDGNIQATTIYKPGINWLDQVWPAEGGANVTEGRTAAAFAGQGSFATQSWINSGNVASFFSYSAFRLSANITRFDGSTIVTETMVVTVEGVSAGFIGQGAGATANNLAQLDPTAQNDINSLKGGKGTYGYAEVKKVVLQPGSSVIVSGAVGVNAGGNSGNIRAQLSAGPSGSAKSVFANGSQEPVGPSEPAISTVSGTFTNSTGAAQLFEITLTVSRVGASAGGTVNSAQSYFT